MTDCIRGRRGLAVVAAALLVQLWTGAAGAEPFAYIANTGSNNVSVIDTATGTPATIVGVGSGPVGVAVNWAGTRVYVGNSDSTVSVIRTDTHTVMATVPAGGIDKGVAVNPAGTRVYVADSRYDVNTGISGNTVAVIDAIGNTLLTTVTVGTAPLGLAVTPDGAWVYVANSEDGTVSVIDTSSNMVVATVTVEWQPYGVAVNPAGTRVYVANSGTNTISVIDTATRSVIETLPTGSTPMGVAVNAAGTRLYVTNRFSTSVSVFDLTTNAPLPAVLLDPFPYGVAVTPDGQRVYVTLETGVAVIDTATDEVSALGGGNSFGRFIRPADTTTHVSVVAPASAVAGSPFAFTVTALDRFNNVATGYTGTVQFTKTDAGAGSAVPANYTFVPADNGVKVFAAGATLVSAGNQSLTAKDTGNAAITGTSNAILVSPLAATHLTVAAPASAVAGSPFAFTVTALDQFNNVAAGYTGTVQFTKTDAGSGSAVPANYTFVAGDNGVKIFASGATLVTPGNRTLTATDTATASITGTSGNILVSAGAATHFTVAAPATAVAGSPFAFTVTALDQFNNVATGYTGTVQFTKTDAEAGSAVPANYTFVAGDNGVKVFASGATLVTQGNRTLTAADTASAAITGTSGNILVSNGAATHFTVAAPAAAVAGTAFNVTVMAIDQFNNTATSYAGTVHFTSTDAAATLPANATLTNGVRVFSATLRTAGSRTLTVADTVAAGVTGTSPAITVTAVKTVSGPSATGSGTITAVLTGGGPGCTFALAQFIAVSGDPGSPPAGSAPPGVDFPHGLFDFRTTGCTPGSTITLTITYPAPIAPGTAYWKYGPRPGPIAAGWYVLPSTVAASTITFSITDGQLGDDDLLANGTIVDQGGPGTAVPVPTLSTWAMIVLALALLVVGAGTLRRRSAVLR